ncbi:MAG: SMC-Scp complex subunit ScpB [Armatimonadetes bacterium]|nr:SMC-Scp complex subunit ScpB [Armatimonadota bacterium]MDW8121295.1 SMC-Scp complex subunit ScpB [Armatimonadota bacterium]
MDGEGVESLSGRATEITEEVSQGSYEELKRGLECVLFVAPRPLTVKELSDILQVSEKKAEGLVIRLAQEYRERSGLLIVEVAGGWRMVTAPEYAPYVRRVFPAPKARLSRSALEVLAIITYHQPISRPEIEALRGVDSEGAIQSLLEYGLIRVVGHRSGAGRARLFGTTTKFLEVFGLRSINDLPPLSEWQERAADILSQRLKEEGGDAQQETVSPSGPFDGQKN